MLKQWEDGEEGVRALWSMMNGWVFAGFKVTYEVCFFPFHPAWIPWAAWCLFVKEASFKCLFWVLICF